VALDAEAMDAAWHVEEADEVTFVDGPPLAVG